MQIFYGPSNPKLLHSVSVLCT